MTGLESETRRTGNGVGGRFGVKESGLRVEDAVDGAVLHLEGARRRRFRRRGRAAFGRADAHQVLCSFPKENRSKFK